MAKLEYRTLLELMRCAKWVDTIFNRALKDEDLTVTQFETLTVLIEHGPLTQAGIVNALGSDSGSVPRLLDRLEREGLVKRGPNKEDARSNLVGVTDGGRKKVASALNSVKKTARNLTGQFSDEETAAFTNGLNKLVKAAREMRQ